MVTDAVVELMGCCVIVMLIPFSWPTHTPARLHKMHCCWHSARDGSAPGVPGGADSHTPGVVREHIYVGAHAIEHDVDAPGMIPGGTATHWPPVTALLQTYSGTHAASQSLSEDLAPGAPAGTSKQVPGRSNEQENQVAGGGGGKGGTTGIARSSVKLSIHDTFFITPFVSLNVRGNQYW